MSSCHPATALQLVRDSWSCWQDQWQHKDHCVRIYFSILNILQGIGINNNIFAPVRNKIWNFLNILQTKSDSVNAFVQQLFRNPNKHGMFTAPSVCSLNFHRPLRRVYSFGFLPLLNRASQNRLFLPGSKAYSCSTQEAGSAVSS